jgi:general stress protein YciG
VRGTSVALDGLAWPFFREEAERELTSRREEDTVAKEDRGFASMDRAKQREIASKGGKAAHQKGTAHEWTSEEARDAGRKGGIASHRRRRETTGASIDTPEAARGTSSADMQGAMRGDGSDSGSSNE